MKGETWKEAKLETAVGVSRTTGNSSDLLLNQSKSKGQEEFESFKNNNTNLHIDEKGPQQLQDLQPIQHPGLKLNLSNDIAMDSHMVMDFLNNPTPADFDIVLPRNACKQMDFDFEKPQVTTKSLIQDGQDIIEYLNLNRYSKDIDGEKHDFDLSLLEDEFEQAKKELNVDRLVGAVNRLRMLQTHLK
jgi:hypothetical protein